MEICSSYSCAVIQHKCSATLFLAKSNPHYSVLLCKTGSQQGCVSAITPMEICSSYRCAVTVHQSTAALFRAKCNPHCSVLLFKTGPQQALCHCSYTYGDLLFIQVCSDARPVHCCTGQGRIPFPLCSAALQTCLTAYCSTGQGNIASPLFSAAL